VCRASAAARPFADSHFLEPSDRSLHPNAAWPDACGRCCSCLARAGADALTIDGTSSDATYVCTLQSSDSPDAWASIDAHYVEAQVSSAPWLRYVLGLSVRVSPVPRNAPLDVGERPDLVRDLHLSTVDGLGNWAFVGSYSRSVSFSGSMTVGGGSAPQVSICIASEVSTPGSTTPVLVWMRADTICR
jgi:hypothetical protein